MSYGEDDMTTPLDLEAYFRRIQWGGETSPTFETLAGLLRAHMLRIQFENLDVLLGRPVRLDLDSLPDKLVRARRDGYCFEHATLFAAVLEKLDFSRSATPRAWSCSRRVRKRPARTCS